ncbi:MAG: DNA repair protein RadA [Spirochaetaceae bacterium]|nr:MAG: DNA repair protein RadA [Spirochaetaceae bacterium]
MSRNRVSFVCRECGHVEPKWLGRCPQCGQWNSLEERTQAAGGGGRGKGTSDTARGGRSTAEGQASIVRLSAVATDEHPRLPSGFDELDRVLGGGVTPGSSVLVGGEPGIGKSTLMLQCAGALAARGVLYVSGEESPHQIRRRADRIGVAGDRIQTLAGTGLSSVLHALESVKPAVCIVDSVQTLHDPEAGAVPGTVNQIRYCCYELADWARNHNTALFLVAHVTKEGVIAGPKVLEHMVDTVLYFEQSESDVRILRAVKNRFGATDEIGVFSMRERGLTQVSDPSSLFLVHRDGKLPAGVVAAPVYEGSRVLLVEIQALTVPAKGGVSRTFSDRIDSGRVSRVAAVLEKHAGIRFSDQDLYVNVAGGMRIAEVGVELPLAMALFSARTGRPLPEKATVTGELSLAGEVRPVPHLRRRVRAAHEFGFTHCFGPAAARDEAGGSENWTRISTVGECIAGLW